MSEPYKPKKEFEKIVKDKTYQIIQELIDIFGDKIPFTDIYSEFQEFKPQGLDDNDRLIINNFIKNLIRKRKLKAQFDIERKFLRISKMPSYKLIKILKDCKPTAGGKFLKIWIKIENISESILKNVKIKIKLPEILRIKEGESEMKSLRELINDFTAEFDVFLDGTCKDTEINAEISFIYKDIKYTNISLEKPIKIKVCDYIAPYQFKNKKEILERDNMKCEKVSIALPEGVQFKSFINELKNDLPLKLVNETEKTLELQGKGKHGDPVLYSLSAEGNIVNSEICYTFEPNFLALNLQMGKILKDLETLNQKVEKGHIINKLEIFIDKPDELTRYMIRTIKSNWSNDKKDQWASVIQEILEEWQIFKPKKWQKIINVLIKTVGTVLIGKELTGCMTLGVQKLFDWIETHSLKKKDYIDKTIIKPEKKARKKAEEKVKKEAEERKIREIESKTRERVQLDDIFSFKGVNLPRYEANSLKEIEKSTNKQFKKLYKIKWDTKTMGFTAENKRVTGIALNNIRLKTLSEAIGDLSSLKELYLNKNQLKNLPDSIENVKSLIHLSLSDNNLTNFPESIIKLTSLQTLNFNGNQLRNLPESIDDLNSLQILILNGNQLTSLPESIGNLKSLQNLDLRYNNLKYLPNSIGNLSSLQKLDLSGNQLAFLPESIGNLESLQTLILENNKLMTLSEAIQELSNLKTLWISGNPLVNKIDEKTKNLLKYLREKGLTIKMVKTLIG